MVDVVPSNMQSQMSSPPIPQNSGRGKTRSFCCSGAWIFLSLGKGVLFQHYLLIPPGFGWDSAACLPFSFFWCRYLSRFFCFLFLLRKRVLFHYNLLILPDFPTLVSVLLSSLVRCCLLSSFFSLRKWVLCYYDLMVPFDLLVPLDSGQGSGICFLFFLFFGSVLVSLFLFFFLRKIFYSIMIY